VTLGLTVTGGEALAKQLRALGAAVRRKALLRVLKTAAEPIRGRAAELAPIDPTSELDLKDWMVISATTQIGAAVGGEWQAAAADEYQAAVAVGPARKVFYGRFVEFGTVKMSAKPFLRPAFDYGSDRALALIREGLWQLLDQANAGAGVFTPEAEE